MQSLLRMEKILLKSVRFTCIITWGVGLSFQFTLHQKLKNEGVGVGWSSVFGLPQSGVEDQFSRLCRECLLVTFVVQFKVNALNLFLTNVILHLSYMLSVQDIFKVPGHMNWWELLSEQYCELPVIRGWVCNVKKVCLVECLSCLETRLSNYPKEIHALFKPLALPSCFTLETN